MEKSSYYLGYHRQLDGLRAFAVFFVLWEHWLYQVNIPGFTPGKFGVYLFFVISGYLITGILLKAKSHQTGFKDLVKTFYIRRFLRIFPLYYAVLFVTYLLAFGDVQQAIVWHSLYLSNIYAYYVSEPVLTGHFWSLAVEEQFYIFWPLLILAVRAKHLVKLLVALLFFSVFASLFIPLFSFPRGFWEATPFGCLHFFAAGALVNFLHQKKIADRLLWLVALASGSIYYLPRISGSQNLFTDLFMAPFLGILVLVVVRGIKGKAGWLLSNKAIVFCGTISYGIYLIHPFVFHGLRELFKANGADFVESAGKAQVPIMFASTLLIASFLYYSLELPVMRLKKYFTYTSRQRGSESTEHVTKQGKIVLVNKKADGLMEK